MLSQNPDFSARRAMLWTLAAFFLGLAIQANNGRYSPVGMILLTLCILCSLGGCFATHLPERFPSSIQALNVLIGLCAVFYAKYWFVPGNTFYTVVQFVGCVLVGAAGVLWVVRVTGTGFFRRFAFPIFLFFQLVSGGLTLWTSHRFELTGHYFVFHVRNDVQIFAEEAAKALMQGKNPYSLRMPNVMGADMPFYSEGTTGPDGRLSFGYPYLPLSALFSLPGYWLGDFRFAHLFALIAAAALLAYARPSTTSKLAATLFLLFPPTLPVLLMSWIEPVAIFFLALTVFCYYRAPRWLFLALGCLVASKQYTFFLLALLPLLVPEKEKRLPLLWKSVAVALVLSVPMALWDVAGFYRSVVEIQFKQPFRTDSLSYLALVAALGGPLLTPLFGFLALIGAILWGRRKAPISIAGWCGAGAVAYLAFFAFNKQAFANYYFWPFSLLMAAVAVALPAQQTQFSSTLDNLEQ